MNHSQQHDLDAEAEACKRDLLAACPEARALVLKMLWKKRPDLVREHLPGYVSVLSSDVT